MNTQYLLIEKKIVIFLKETFYIKGMYNTVLKGK